MMGGLGGWVFFGRLDVFRCGWFEGVFWGCCGRIIKGWV